MGPVSQQGACSHRAAERYSSSLLSVGLRVGELTLSGVERTCAGFMYITGGMRTRRNRYGRSPHEKGWITATREPSQELMRLLTADARCLLRVSEANADGREVEAGRGMGRASGGSSLPPVPVSNPQARGGPTLGIAF